MELYIGKHDYESGKDLDAYKLRFKISPNSKNLFNYLTEKEKNYKIEEYLGTYYEEDLNETPIVSNDEGTEELLPDTNKTEKRVITYEFVSQ